MSGSTGRLARTVVFTVACIALVPAPAPAQSQCGVCDPGQYWSGVQDAAYRFEQGTPSFVEEAAFWADDGWNGPYYDPNNQNGTLIRVVNNPNEPGVLGRYSNITNVLTVNLGSDILSDCNGTMCSALIATIAHEFGHVLGLDDMEFGSGCVDSIMSYDSDIHSVIGPSSEDLCWLLQYSGGGGGGGGICPEDQICEYERRDRERGATDRAGAAQTVSASALIPVDRNAGEFLIAIIRYTGSSTAREQDGRPDGATGRAAEILQIISASKSPDSSEIFIASSPTSTEFAAAPHWNADGSLLAFLRSDEGTQVYRLVSVPRLLSFLVASLLWVR